MSGINGWMDALSTTGGSGRPGSNTGSGGNGSDGCATGTVITVILQQAEHLRYRWVTLVQVHHKTIRS